MNPQLTSESFSVRISLLRPYSVEALTQYRSSLARVRCDPITSASIALKYDALAIREDFNIVSTPVPLALSIRMGTPSSCHECRRRNVLFNLNCVRDCLPNWLRQNRDRPRALHLNFPMVSASNSISFVDRICPRDWQQDSCDTVGLYVRLLAINGFHHLKTARSISAFDNAALRICATFPVRLPWLCGLPRALCLRSLAASDTLMRCPQNRTML